jgi:hypothetical protein
MQSIAVKKMPSQRLTIPSVAVFLCCLLACGHVGMASTVRAPVAPHPRVRVTDAQLVKVKQWIETDNTAKM